MAKYKVKEKQGKNIMLEKTETKTVIDEVNLQQLLVNRIVINNKLTELIDDGAVTQQDIDDLEQEIINNELFI